MNAIDQLKKEHREAEALFKKIHSGHPQILDSERRTTVLKLCEALTAHMEAEEQVFYPRVAQENELKEKVKHSREEHAEVKDLIEDIRQQVACCAKEGNAQPSAEPCLKNIQKLQDAISHHVSEEENELFPEVERCIPETELKAMTQKIKQVESEVKSQAA